LKSIYQVKTDVNKQTWFLSNIITFQNKYISINIVDLCVCDDIQKITDNKDDTKGVVYWITEFMLLLKSWTAKSYITG